MLNVNSWKKKNVKINVKYMYKKMRKCDINY